MQVIEADYREGVSCNLDKNIDNEKIRSVILKRGYYTDSTDADLIASILTDSIKAGNSLSGLNSLRDRKWKIPASCISSTNETILTNNLKQACQHVNVGYLSRAGTDNVVNLKQGNGSITARVVCEDSSLCDVSVYLRQHSFDSLGRPVDSVIAIAKTSSEGLAIFKGLNLDSSYSVLPVSDGFEYGFSQGTSGGTLGSTAQVYSGWIDRVRSLFKKKYGHLEFTFQQQPLRIPMFSDATLRQIKEDKAFTLYTPEQWKNIVTRMATLFLMTWWFLCFVIWFRRRKDAVVWPVALMMGITGIGLLGMLSYNDPFTDRMIAQDYLVGVVVGVVLMVIFQYVDLRKFYSSPLFDIVGSKTGNKGLGYLILAIVFTLMLFTPLGHSVGGMGVNLKIGSLMFQPSEIAKYLVVFFLATWFCRKADSLVGYSDEGNIDLLRNKIRHVSGIFLALCCMLAIYMALGDMGPGLVLLFSFIIIYSIIKSKSVKLDANADFMARVSKSDISLLIVGVVSFVSMLWIGGKLQLSGLFAVLWFLIWIVVWALVKRKLVETPIMANAVIAVFVFAKDLPGSIGERFATRSAMCSNPWGNLGLDSTTPIATPNGQVAEGLWGLASGGFWGQGFGNGTPNYIPAFHTDMVLTSLGEIMGWTGITLVILLIFALLHYTLDVGYRSHHQFSFFVCIGIAVVTAVQFTVITLGSTGVIPLTGVAVPLLSYGKVSMITTLAAFGLVLSVQSHTHHSRNDSAAERAAENLVLPYDAPIAVTRATWFFITLFLIGVLTNPMVINRNQTLVHPLFVTTLRGDNIIQYNPRIADITRNLHSGNIYDRNGLLLATSVADSVKKDAYTQCGVYQDELNDVLLKRTRRYYPLGDRLLFVVGDINPTISLPFNEYNPMGYVAESQYMSYLRGYDNVLYLDEEHQKPYYVDITSESYKASRFQQPVQTTASHIIVRDYSSLLPLLKAGKNSRRLERVNKRTSKTIKPQDLRLTLDAKLQCLLQDRIESYINDKYPNNRLMRVSVVVLDAQNGDLLASALYPLPNKDTLLAHSDEKNYNDAYFPPTRRAYTDRDLGTTFFTAPGSTAKVMTAMAAMQKEGSKAANHHYSIPIAEQVEVGIEPTGNVSMERAIVESSNCYFIHLMNDRNLYSALDSIYTATGAQIGREFKKRSILVTPYVYAYKHLSDKQLFRWKEIISKQENEGLSLYNSYKERLDRKPEKMNKPSWMWAWGQGTLAASPLSMARVVSAVANGGVMPLTRYRLDEPYREGIRLMNNESAAIIKRYMHTMAENANGHPENAIRVENVGGKTGTPERQYTKYNKLNDGWFIFYVDKCSIPTGKTTEKHPLAVAVRMERGVGSGPAMRLSRDVVLQVLKECDY